MPGHDPSPVKKDDPKNNLAQPTKLFLRHGAPTSRFQLY
ncbi:hypothetical protein LFAB_02385 [Lactiplantibacillus fabifermentans T30PCM01]|uniref:Uncharacterized protein n=1 Tax=Lactiplantibacillus fabifermentans T30PCM01 TaxID=1400520 RepID=W6TB45_9LACO|nr:hypothetical protein LFAB_02385 [Lactiplantibacillus fabifermentans T30PCM01]